MPIQLNYTDQNLGLNIPAAYFTPALVNIDTAALTVAVTIKGYITKALMTAGKHEFMSIPEFVTFAQLGVTGASTLGQFSLAIQTWALTNDSFFAGGSIVA